MNGNPKETRRNLKQNQSQAAQARQAQVQAQIDAQAQAQAQASAFALSSFAPLASSSSRPYTAPSAREYVVPPTRQYIAPLAVSGPAGGIMDQVEKALREEQRLATVRESKIRQQALQGDPLAMQRLADQIKKEGVSANVAQKVQTLMAAMKTTPEISGAEGQAHDASRPPLPYTIWATENRHRVHCMFWRVFSLSPPHWIDLSRLQPKLPSLQQLKGPGCSLKNGASFLFPKSSGCFCLQVSYKMLLTCLIFGETQI